MGLSSRWSSHSAAIALWTLGAAFFAGPVRAQQYAAPASNEQLVSLDVRDARLEDVIKILTMRTGITNISIVPPEAGKSYGLVTTTLADQPLSKVLRVVANTARAVVSQEDGIYYLRPLTANDSSAAAAASPRLNSADVSQAVVVPAIAPAPARVSGPKQTVKIRLNFMQPSVLKNTLYDSTYLHADELDADAVMNPKPSAQPLPIILNGGGGGGDLSAANNGYSAGRQGYPGGGGGGGFGGGLAGGGGFGGQGGGGGGLAGGGGGLGGGQAGGGAGNALLPEGVTNVIAYDADNSVLVTGDPEGIAAFQDLVRLLDVPPRQVLIKVEFIDVGIQELDSFGIDWRIRPAGNLDIATTSVGSGGSISLAYASGNAVAALRAALTRTNINVVQSPIVTTVNNGIGFVTISDIVPTFQQSQIVTGNGNVITQTTQRDIPSVNGLVVQPRINGDNSISLFVQPQLSSFTLVPGPAGTIGAQIRNRTVGATRRIRNNETMVLGGFITRSDARATNRVPILSDLPIIGSLFRSRERTVSGTETLVFLTPTIIDDASTGTTGAIQAPPTP